MKAAMQLLGHDPDELEIAITQMVDFAGWGRSEDERPVGVSSRRRHRRGRCRRRCFTYLMQSVDSRQTFDLEEVAKQGMDNPVFYVQYAHARICSIFAKAAEAGVERSPLADVDTSLLVHERELDLLRSLQNCRHRAGVCRQRSASHRRGRGAGRRAARLLPRLLRPE